MALLEFKDLSFSEKDDKVRVNFLSIYVFDLDKKELSKLGKFRIERNSIEFTGDKKEDNVRQKFMFLLDRGFSDLKSNVNNKPALYIHRNSGIPLIGSNEFGIVERGTNTIEVKPLTTCNIDCIFCSVDHTKRNSDVVVEREYLVEELEKVARIKENRVNIHIGSQGDPSLYGDLEGLVGQIRKIQNIGPISMVTNGILITKKRADALIDAGMTHFHISLHTTDPEKATKMANTFYPVNKVMEVCEYIASGKRAKVLLVPVWVPGINDKDIEDVIVFGKKIGAQIGIQNFLEYNYGKHPANPIPMKVFFQKLKDLEKKYDADLTGLEGELLIKPDARLPKPFRKGDVIEVELMAHDRMRNTVVGVAKERVVTVINCSKTKGIIKVRLIRDKDNIFTGVGLVS